MGRNPTNANSPYDLYYLGCPTRVSSHWEPDFQYSKDVKRVYYMKCDYCKVYRNIEKMDEECKGCGASTWVWR